MTLCVCADTYVVISQAHPTCEEMVELLRQYQAASQIPQQSLIEDHEKLTTPWYMHTLIKLANANKAT